MELVRKIVLWGSLAAAFYMLLAFHYIYFGGVKVKMLKKTNYTLMETFTDLSSKAITNKKILQNDALREAGLADLLVDMGRMSEKERDRIMAKYEEEYE
ncbi:MAG: hypothetical protein JRJ21_06445 [Deltaproteobacteria bacterium]|nr:hypothetical protein [Deltaproteobacteria bacterium]